MNYSKVIRRSVHLLAASTSTPKEREVAAATLVAAAEEGLAPPGSAPALWGHLTANPTGQYSTRTAEAIGRWLPFDPEVHASILAVVTSAGSHADLFEVALFATAGATRRTKTSDPKPPRSGGSSPRSTSSGSHGCSETRHPGFGAPWLRRSSDCPRPRMRWN